MHPVVPISLVIVHASEAMRLGLRVGMEREGVTKVVLELAEPGKLAALWPDEGVQVVLLFLNTAISVALDAVRWVRSRSPGTAVLVLGELTPGLAQRAVEAKANGLLHADAPLAEILRGVSVLSQGGLFFNGSYREHLLERKKKGSAREQDVQLTDMQLKVLRLLCRAECLTRQQIADELDIGKRTVDDHIEALFDKFKVRSTRALVQLALKRGLHR